MGARTTSPAAIEVEGLSRGAFIVRGAFAVAAAYGAAAAGPAVAAALAQQPASDLAVLNFALTLETVESAFYAAAVKLRLPGALGQLATEFGEHEREHATSLSQSISQLGGQPATAPRVRFPGLSAGSFLRTAQTLEDTGVAAYNGALPSLQSPDLIAAGASIVQVEARHAAAVRLRAGAAPTTGAFERPLGRSQALAALRPFTG